MTPRKKKWLVAALLIAAAIGFAAYFGGKSLDGGALSQYAVGLAPGGGHDTGYSLQAKIWCDRIGGEYKLVTTNVDRMCLAPPCPQEDTYYRCSLPSKEAMLPRCESMEGKDRDACLNSYVSEFGEAEACDKASDPDRCRFNNFSGSSDDPERFCAKIKDTTLADSCWRNAGYGGDPEAACKRISDRTSRAYALCWRNAVEGDPEPLYCAHIPAGFEEKETCHSVVKRATIERVCGIPPESCGGQIGGYLGSESKTAAEYCETIQDPSGADDCRALIGGERGDPSVCEKISVQDASAAWCWFEVAERTRDASLCERIPADQTDWRTECARATGGTN